MHLLHSSQIGLTEITCGALMLSGPNTPYSVLHTDFPGIPMFFSSKRELP